MPFMICRRWLFSFFPLMLLLLVLLLTACPATQPPCQGDTCPQLCTNTQPAAVAYRYNDAVYSSEPRNAFVATGKFDDCYVAGASVNSTFSFTLEKATLDLEQAILRFDIVTEQGTTVLRSNPIIDTNSFKLTPDLTEPETFFSKQNMLDGISVTGSFDFSQSAPKGSYRVVISVVPTTNSKVPADTVKPIVSFNYVFRIDR
jgi:hypothetical protein